MENEFLLTFKLESNYTFEWFMSEECMRERIEELKDESATDIEAIKLVVLEEFKI